MNNRASREQGIEEYFKNNPSDMPQFKNNDYSSIPPINVP